jgi:hypothetical protein
MAFGWDDLIYAGMTAYGASQAGKAADKSGKGGQNALAEQQRQYNTNLTMLEPTRALGYGAQSDIASLYGYRLPAYTPLNALGASGQGGAPGGSSNWQLGGPMTINGRDGNPRIAGISVNPFNSYNAKRGGVIDPMAGTVQVDAKKANKQERLSEAATNYLRGDADELKGGKLSRIRRAIDGMREQGYEWTDAPPEPTAGPIEGADGSGTAGNFGRFFASPDYEFRRSEGIRGLEQGAAARGGELGGKALRATR